MCEVTARVAVALKSSVEETAQTREAVALLNDQASFKVREVGPWGISACLRRMDGQLPSTGEDGRGSLEKFTSIGGRRAPTEMNLESI